MTSVLSGDCETVEGKRCSAQRHRSQVVVMYGWPSVGERSYAGATDGARVRSVRERTVGHREPAPIEHTRGSPRSQATRVRSSNSESMPSDFARRVRRSTATLEGRTTYTSTPCFIGQRASQKPDHPAS